MERKVGTISRGVRCPIIGENDNLADIVVESVLDAAKSEGFELRDRDVISVTESIVARAQGNYASIDAIAEDVDGELGTVISCVSSFLHVPEVIADAGDAKESSPLRQAIQNLIQRKSFLLQERNDKGVDVAAAVGLNYAHLQGDTEAGINALAVVDGTQRTAAAQVTGDSLAGGSIHIGKRLSHIAMGSAVISQALDAIFFIPFPGNAVDTPFQWDSLMESRLKSTHQHSVGRQLLKLEDSLQIRFVVGRRYHHVVLHALKNFRGQLMDTVMVFGENRLEAHARELGQIR